eukprot:4560264-Alexandrium_andersonii.AAC.1
MQSTASWNCSCTAACTMPALASPSVTTKHRHLASASSAVTRTLPAWSCVAIGISPTGRNQAAVSCS